MNSDNASVQIVLLEDFYVKTISSGRHLVFPKGSKIYGIDVGDYMMANTRDGNVYVPKNIVEKLKGEETVL